MKTGKDLDNQALLRFEKAAEDLGARFERFYPKDVHRIPEYDAVLIRADTHAMNMTYTVARLAESEGIPVLDEPDSIATCGNKIHMGRLMERHAVPTPPTRYLLKADAQSIEPERLFEELGSPLVLKAPTSAFSAYVEKVNTPEEFKKESKRFLRLTDGLVVQAFMPTTYDWRVGVLDGRILYVARYHMPKGAWRVYDREEGTGQKKWGRVEAVPLGEAPKELLKVAKQGTAAIGNSLYGCDIKQSGDSFYVIEVNDNPTIYPGYEDSRAPHLYEDIVRHLLEGGIG